MPSPPEATTRSKPSAPAQASRASKSSSRTLSTHSSPSRASERSNWNTASEPNPDLGLWMMRVRMGLLPGTRGLLGIMERAAAREGRGTPLWYPNLA